MRAGALNPQSPHSPQCPHCRDRGWIVTRPADGAAVSGSAIPCECRRDQRVHRLQNAAEIPERYSGCTLENFQVASGGEAGSQLVRARATCERYLDGFLGVDGSFSQSGLLFVGRAGVGKTHLAVACLKEVMRRYGRQGRFADFTTLVHRMQISFDPSSEESRRHLLEPLGSVDILVLDELGAQKPTPFVRDLLYLIINTRYSRRLPTIFTTNFPLVAQPAADREQDSFTRRQALPDEQQVTLENRIGKPLLSRLCEMARPVDLSQVEDFRREVRMHQLRT